VSPRVLVTDGEERAALAVVRSLGRAGHDVYVCSTSGRSLAGSSRFCRAESSSPDPLTQPANLVEELARLVMRWGVEVVCPVTEASLRAVLPARKLVGDARIPFVDAEVFSRASDKRFVARAAESLGIEVPRRVTLVDPRDRETVDMAALSYPLVLKPSRSVVEAGAHRQKLGVSYAANRQELEVRLSRLPDAAYPLQLQQRIVGPGCGVFVLLWEGDTLALFAHRRIREKPPSGGVSVYRQSIIPEPELVDQATRLLRFLEWTGVAMVEFKRDAKSGTPYLMEINGRFWGSLQLAVDAGVDFPALLIAAALDQRPDPVTRYRVGVRSRWWWGDIDHLLIRLRHSAADLNLPPDAPSTWRVLREFLTLWRPGDHSEVFRLADPWPFLRETLQWFMRR
jgi:predicted ATP-grasp superfamily ATP-dependent carboligase